MDSSGAMTVGIMTLNLTTLGIMPLSITATEYSKSHAVYKILTVMVSAI